MEKKTKTTFETVIAASAFATANAEMLGGKPLKQIHKALKSHVGEARLSLDAVKQICESHGIEIAKQRRSLGLPGSTTRYTAIAMMMLIESLESEGFTVPPKVREVFRMLRGGRGVDEIDKMLKGEDDEADRDTD